MENATWFISTCKLSADKILNRLSLLEFLVTQNCPHSIKSILDTITDSIDDIEQTLDMALELVKC